MAENVVSSFCFYINKNYFEMFVYVCAVCCIYVVCVCVHLHACKYTCVEVIGQLLGFLLLPVGPRG